MDHALNADILVEHLGTRVRIGSGAPCSELGDSRSSCVTVSIVIPLYNSSLWLASLFQAIMALQAPRDGLEVIVVDDGSTDDTLDRLQEWASVSPWPVRVIHLRGNLGRSVARNVGVLYAQAPIVAFTDADCLPHPNWLVAALPSFADETLGMVQGRTLPLPGVPPPLFSHFMEVHQPDGHYATCNMLYRRAVLLDAGGFDPALDPNDSLLGTWEDVDMGWRVRERGWGSLFVADAIVYHQIVRLSLMQWLKWSVRLARRPEIAAHYPAYRSYLYRNLWVDASHAWLTLAAIGGVLATVIHPVAIALVAPYCIHIYRHYELRGYWPVAKLALHILWDVIGFAALAVRSVQFRALVL